MSASEVQICNMGLMKFGDVSITSLDDANKEARFCKVFYPLLRDRLLYQHPWNFALARADISAQLTAPPAFEWDYAYTLPADCLRVWELYGSTAKWVVEGNLLLTSQDAEIYIRYIKQQTTTGRFNPAFVNCLATFLAAEGANKIGGDRKRRSELLTELHTIDLPAAYRLNAIEGAGTVPTGEQPMDAGNYTWQSAGR